MNLKHSDVLKSMRRTRTISAWFCDGTAGLSSVRNTGWKHLEITEGLFLQLRTDTEDRRRSEFTNDIHVYRWNLHTEEFTVSYFNVSRTFPLLIIAGMDPVFSVEAKRGKNFDPGGGGKHTIFPNFRKSRLKLRIGTWNWERFSRGGGERQPYFHPWIDKTSWLFWVHSLLTDP